MRRLAARRKPQQMRRRRRLAAHLNSIPADAFSFVFFELALGRSQFALSSSTMPGGASAAAVPDVPDVPVGALEAEGWAHNADGEIVEGRPQWCKGRWASL